MDKATLKEIEDSFDESEIVTIMEAGRIALKQSSTRESLDLSDDSAEEITNKIETFLHGSE